MITLVGHFSCLKSYLVPVLLVSSPLPPSFASPQGFYAVPQPISTVLPPEKEQKKL